MKFFLLSSAIIGASLVLASPVQKRQDTLAVTQIEQVTTVVGQEAPSGNSASADANLNADVLDIVLTDENLNPVQNGTSFTSGTDTNDVDGSIVGYTAGASSSVTGPSNPNEIGGGPGNAGSILGSGTNDFGTSKYSSSNELQAGESANGSYGRDSGPGGNSYEIGDALSEDTGSPASNSSVFFRLVANVTGSDPYGIHGLYLGTYHVSAGSSIAHLSSGSGNSSTGSGTSTTTGIAGRVFHTNGTAAELARKEGTTATSGGTDPFPESIVLTDGLATTNVAASDLNNIYINAGEGTKGVEIERNDNGVYVLSGAGDAGYFACFNDHVPYNSTQTLKYLTGGEAVPEQCTPIVLIPECASDDGNPYTTGSNNADEQNVEGCYLSVAAIDWNNAA